MKKIKVRLCARKSKMGCQLLYGSRGWKRSRGLWDFPDIDHPLPKWERVLGSSEKQQNGMSVTSAPGTGFDGPWEGSSLSSERTQGRVQHSAARALGGASAASASGR